MQLEKLGSSQLWALTVFLLLAALHGNVAFYISFLLRCALIFSSSAVAKATEKMWEKRFVSAAPSSAADPNQLFIDYQ